MSAMDIINQTKEVATENAPSILAALAVGGVATTGFLAFNFGVRFGRDQREDEINGDKPMTGKEKLEIYWRPIVPTLLVAGTTITCVIASTAINNRRNAVLGGLVTLGEVTLREYKEKVREVVTKDKNERIDRELAQKKLDEAGDKEVIYVGDGDILMFDVLTSRTFKSSRLAVERAEVEIGRRLLSSDYVSQNEWYDEIGLGRVAMGDEIGWNHDVPLEVKFVPLIKDDKPVMGVDYRFPPFSTFDKLS